jgi:hypothetical protein
MRHSLLAQAVNRRFRRPDDVTELGGFAAVAKAVALGQLEAVFPHP